MTCAQYAEALHGSVDGTLGPIRLAALQVHLDQCESCRALRDDMERIRHLAGSLDRLQPPTGAWIQIAGRLRQEGRLRTALPPAAGALLPAIPRRGYALAAIAAALLLAVGASLAVLFPLLRGAGEPGAAFRVNRPSGNAAAGAVQESIEAEFRLAEQHYQAAITKLEAAAQSDGGAIDPQTAAMIRTNLEIIDAAIAESRAALQTEPSSTPARDSLFGALRRKVALLQDTIALLNEIRKGNAEGSAQLIGKADKS